MVLEPCRRLEFAKPQEDSPAVRADGPKAQPATTDGGSGSVVIDMARGWVRHDGERCADPTRIAFAGGAISFYPGVRPFSLRLMP